MAVKLTKPILDALQNFGVDYIFWKLSNGDLALFVQTGFHENGRKINRRLYRTPYKDRAMAICYQIDEKCGSRLKEQLARGIRELEWDMTS